MIICWSLSVDHTSLRVRNYFTLRKGLTIPQALCPITPPVSHGKELGKIFSPLCSGRRKLTMFRYSQSIYHNKNILFFGNNLPEITFPTQKPNYPTPAPLAILFHVRWGEKEETLVKDIAQGHKLTKRITFNHKII